MVEDGIIIRRPLVIPSHGSEDMIDALPVLRSVRSNVERVHLQLVITHIEAAHAFNHEAGAFLGIEQVAPDPGELGKARSEEHTSELQSLMRISYAVFCLKKKTRLH